MRMGITYRMKRGPDGEPAVDQGLVHGLPCTYNPDDGRFYLHAPGTSDGTNALTAYSDWRNLVQGARRLGPKSGDDAGKGA